MSELRTVVEDLTFAEGPRWHDGALWFSDMHDHTVLRCDVASGDTEVVAGVPNQPSGLGWTPEGDLLVVSMTDRRLLRVGADGNEEIADLSDLAPWHCNDMVVAPDGSAYVGNFGFDLYASAPDLRTTMLVLVRPDGEVASATEDLAFPNGTVITPDSATLIVAETFAGRLSAFDITDDGALTGRREWAPLPGTAPDGICLDTDGAVWVADATGHECLRVAEGGEVLDRVEVPAPRHCFAAMLGGDDGRTLFLCTAVESQPDRARELRSGRIEAIEVEAPHAGYP